MTEQGAAADNACRDGAPGGAGSLARTRASSQDAPSWVSQTRLRSRSQGSWRLPALHSAPMEGKRKKGDGPARGPKNHDTGQRSVGFLDSVRHTTGSFRGAPTSAFTRVFD